MPDVFIPGFNSPVEEFDCFGFKLTHKAARHLNKLHILYGSECLYSSPVTLNWIASE